MNNSLIRSKIFVLQTRFLIMQLHFHFNPAAIPTLPLDHTACTRLLCDACGGPGSGGCCRREPWLLKYIMCVIFQPQSTQSAQSVFTFICVYLCPSAVNFCRNPPPFVPSLSLCPASLHYTLPPQPVRAAGWQPSVWIRASLEPQINANKRRYCR